MFCGFEIFIHISICLYKHISTANPVESLHLLFLLTPSLDQGMTKGAMVRWSAQSSEVEFLSQEEWTEAAEITVSTALQWGC